MSVRGQLALTSDRAQVEAGGRAVLTAWITNSSAYAEEFSLQPRGVEPAWMTFRPPTVTVQPGQQVTSSILIDPPADAVSADLVVTITLVARSVGATIAEASVPLRLLGTAAPIAPQGPMRTATPSGHRVVWLAGAAVGLVLIAAVIGVLIHNRGSGDGSTTPAGPVGTPCTDSPTKLATLFSDNSLTAIRLSDEDTTNLQVLQTEQARILPPLYEPLLALSGDASRLAYVTASNESMDDAHLWYLTVASPNQATELASISQGFWNVKPAWSPDNKQLAFLRLNTQSAAQGKTELELWIAEVGGQAHKVNLPTDLLRPDDFTANPTLPLCWAADNKTVIFTNVAHAASPIDQGTRYTGSSAAGTQAVSPTATSTRAATATATDTLAVPQQIEVDVTTGARRDAARPDQPLPAVADVAPPPPAQPKGTNCTLTAYSQNDPRWSSQVMRAGGDRIGPFGCALTSATMVLNYYGAGTDPGTLNACLGSYAEDIYWSQAVGCVNGKVTGANAFDFSWPNLDQVLAKGKPAIVGLLGGQAGSHFVVVTSGGGGDASNYAVTDPWDASTNHTLATLISRGYNPRWIRTYDGSDQGCMRVVGAPAPADDPNGVTINSSGRPLAPAQLMDFFTRAASQTGVPREYLLAIASIESNFTPRAQGPLIPQFAANEDAHALGMMQFLPSTYRGLIPRVDKATGKNLGGDGIWDPESAIFAAAFYLRDAGAPGNMHDAIFSYNRAEWYVAEVVALAKKYAGGAILDDNIYDPNGSNKPGTRSDPNPPNPPTGATAGTLAPTATSTAIVPAGLATSTPGPTATATHPVGTVGKLATVTPHPTASKTAKSPTPKGGKPAPKPLFVWSVADGSIHQGDVRLDLSWFGDIGEVVSATVLNLTLDNAKPGPVPSQEFTQGMTLTDEGIYQVVIVTRKDDQLQVTRRKFTIDRTAPLLNVMLGNGVQASAGPAVIPF
ncbi:MAG: transglycosylase SLT domain-containing protein, partial [Thermomicrobiales bacterium]